MRIDLSDDELQDLRSRLRRTRFSAPTAPGWEHGIEASSLRDLVEYWATDFDWRAVERGLNEWEHVLVPIGEGREVHVVLRPSGRAGAIPLLLLHGWPGSFVQMLDLAALLPDFDVVIGSLPGVGFSSPISDAGEAGMADAFAEVMAALGRDDYVVHGTDFGAGVASEMAVRHPDRVRAIHIGGTSPRAGGITADDPEVLRRYAADVAAWRAVEVGYAQIQGTKPDTLAAALVDSPAGLAAWIVEKFRRWSDCGGDVERRFTKDQLLTNVMIYWITGSIGSSMALYAAPGGDTDLRASAVPVAHLMSDRDMLPTPREWVERGSRIDRWTRVDRGGHFIEWEEPQLVADDIRAFVGEL